MSDIGTQVRDYLDATTTPIGAKELIMGSTFTEEREPAPPEKNRTWRWAAVAIAAAAVVVLGWFLLPDGSTDLAPIDEPGGQSVPSTPVELVESAIDAYDRGDLEALAALIDFDPEAPLEYVLNPMGFLEARMAAGAAFVLDEPCAATGESGEVRCAVADTNDFWAPSGLSRPGEWIVVVDGGRIVSEQFVDASNQSRLGQFGNAFFGWLADAHPDVYDSMPEFEVTGLGVGQSIHPMSFGASGFPIAEAVPTALEYVEEFVAQSPDYPVTP